MLVSRNHKRYQSEISSLIADKKKLFMMILAIEYFFEIDTEKAFF